MCCNKYKYRQYIGNIRIERYVSPNCGILWNIVEYRKLIMGLEYRWGKNPRIPSGWRAALQAFRGWGSWLRPNRGVQNIAYVAYVVYVVWAQLRSCSPRNGAPSAKRHCRYLQMIGWDESWWVMMYQIIQIYSNSWAHAGSWMTEYYGMVLEEGRKVVTQRLLVTAHVHSVELWLRT